jgi:predicted DNA-binding transcriptional regulator AlpA
MNAAAAPQPKQYLTTAQVMGMANVSANTLRRLVRQGLLPAPVKLSDRSQRWDATAVETALANLATAPAAAGTPTT